MTGAKAALNDPWLSFGRRW